MALSNEEELIFSMDVYSGHVCAFTKLQIMGEKEAYELDNVFSRGMDLDVPDPSHCHGHPPVPPNWPSSEALINYVTRTRMMILKETAKGNVTTRC